MKRILIVEDDVIIADMNKEIVEMGGWTVVDIADTGEKAIELFRKHKPDIILMDIFLDSEMDGIQAMETIRKESNIPVIYMTGNSENPTKARAEHTNYSAYLIKPIEPQKLLSEIKKI